MPDRQRSKPPFPPEELPRLITLVAFLRQYVLHVTIDEFRDQAAAIAFTGKVQVVANLSAALGGPAFGATAVMVSRSELPSTILHADAIRDAAVGTVTLFNQWHFRGPSRTPD